MTVTPRRLTVAALLLTAPAWTACSESGADDAAPASPPPSAPASTLASASPTASESPWSVIKGPLSRCGPQPAEVAQVPWRYRVLRDREVGAVPAASAGRGRTVAVLLHQTNGGGLCGWLPYAEQLAGSGVTPVLIDLCRYGEAACRDGVAETAPVRLAVEHARGTLGARRVVVVGASMGGSVALMSGATLDGIDSVVDLSGPVDWPGIEVVRGGRALRVPALVAMAEAEGAEEVEGARTIAEAAPAGSRFVLPETAHGYELLHDFRGDPLPFGEDVLTWIRRGSFAPSAGAGR